VQVFCAEGYARSSVDAIAAAAGVGKQTIYGRCGDKQRLFFAAVTDAREGLPDRDTDLVPDTGDPAVDLQVAGERILAVALSPKVAALHRLTVAEVTHHPELQRFWREGADPRWTTPSPSTFAAATPPAPSRYRIHRGPPVSSPTS
jgi:TetR/AcrR family transcriptional repressor of mexJK operon